MLPNEQKRRAGAALKASLLVTLLLVVAAAGVSAQARRGVSREESKSFTVGGAPSLHVKTFDGALRIEAWDRNEVSYTAELRGRTEADLDRIEIEAAQTGDQILIEARPRERRGVTWNSWASASFTVRVPRRANVRAHSGDGHIEARDLTGEIDLNTGDGHIEAANLSGNLAARTGDGRITLTDVRGRLRARTGDGHVSVRGTFDELEVTTGDGAMEVTVERGSNLAAPWRLQTGDGSIQLALPDGLSAELDVHTNDGSISSELPLTVAGKLGGNSLRGRLNAGGNALTVSTGDGSITLRRN
jgi:hypothetical protein